MNAKEQMEIKIMTEERMFELIRKYLRNMEIRHWCFLCFGAPEEVSALVHGRNVILHSFETTRNKWSGMIENKSNVILSPLWASGSVVRRSMVRIVKVACGSKDSDGAFALSAQPLRMTESIKNKGLVKVVICNGGVIC